MKKRMPKNWRILVSQKLDKQGVVISSQEVADILRGRKINVEYREMLLKAMVEVRKEHAAWLQRVEKELKVA